MFENFAKDLRPRTTTTETQPRNDFDLLYAALKAVLFAALFHDGRSVPDVCLKLY